MIKSIRLIVLCIIVFLIVSCAQQSKNDQTESTSTGIATDSILIGVSTPLTGHGTYLGKQLTQGSLAYINSINDKGGIKGREIKLKILDDGYEPARTLENTKQLIDKEKVFMLFDYVGSPTTKVIISLVNKRHIPLLAPFTGADFIRIPMQPYVFNIRPSYSNEIENMIDKFVKMGKKRIVAFLQDDAYGDSILMSTELALARHRMDIITSSYFTRGMMPDARAVKKLVDAKPDVVVMAGMSKPIAAFVKMAMELGLTQTYFYSVSGVGAEGFASDLSLLGRGIGQNVYVSQVFPYPYDEKIPVVKEFIALFKFHYPKEKPNYVALEGFINAKILVEALSRCGKKIDRARFIDIMLNMKDYAVGNGLLPHINKYDHSFYHKTYLSIYKNGKFQVVE